MKLFATRDLDGFDSELVSFWYEEDEPILYEDAEGEKMYFALGDDGTPDVAESCAFTMDIEVFENIYGIEIAKGQLVEIETSAQDIYDGEVMTDGDFEEYPEELAEGCL